MDYTKKLLKIRQLRMGGYKFENNDLTYEEWIDMGKLEQWVPQIPRL
ncbi:MAG: hypothetical protein ABIK68_05270 [bacterium]